MTLFERLDRCTIEAPTCQIIGTTAAIIGSAVASAAAGVGSSAIGAHAAGNAADAQAAAADRAANLQYQLGEQGLNLQQQQYNNTQAQQLPFLQGGQASFANLLNLLGLPVNGNLAQLNPATAANNLAPQADYGNNNFDYLVNSGDPRVSPNAETTQQWMKDGTPFQNITTSDGRTVAVKTSNQPESTGLGQDAGGVGQGGQGVPLSSLINPALGATGSLMQPWTEQFQAPTDVTEKNDPGYQFRLNEGMKALQRSAASKGDLLSGGTAKGLERYGQDYASNEYQNVYNRSLGEYQQKYNINQQNQANQFNRLASILGVGQTSAGQLQSAGQNFANSGSTILNNVGSQVGNDINNAAAARASGYVGAGNAWSSGISGLGNNISQLSLLSQLLKK
jgi:hypothetical protein